MDDIKKKNIFSLFQGRKGGWNMELGMKKKKPNFMLGDIWGILQILPHSINF